MCLKYIKKRSINKLNLKAMIILVQKREKDKKKSLQKNLATLVQKRNKAKVYNHKPLSKS